MSTGLPYFFPSRTSGATYPGVPHVVFNAEFCELIRESPKSATCNKVDPFGRNIARLPCEAPYYWVTCTTILIFVTERQEPTDTIVNVLRVTQIRTTTYRPRSRRYIDQKRRYRESRDFTAVSSSRLHSLWWPVECGRE